MKRGQLAILAFAALAVGLIAFAGGGGDDGGGRHGTPQADAPAKAPAGALRITFAYSPEKEPLLEPLIERFNASRTRRSAASRSSSRAESSASGDAEQRIAARPRSSRSHGRPPRRCGAGC